MYLRYFNVHVTLTSRHVCIPRPAKPQTRRLRHPPTITPCPTPNEDNPTLHPSLHTPQAQPWSRHAAEAPQPSARMQLVHQLGQRRTNRRSPSAQPSAFDGRSAELPP
jgi:hypothetical protein